MAHFLCDAGTGSKNLYHLCARRAVRFFCRILYAVGIVSVAVNADPYLFFICMKPRCKRAKQKSAERAILVQPRNVQNIPSSLVEGRKKRGIDAVDGQRDILFRDLVFLRKIFSEICADGKRAPPPVAKRALHGGDAEIEMHGRDEGNAWQSEARQGGGVSRVRVDHGKAFASQRAQGADRGKYTAGIAPLEGCVENADAHK